MAIALLLTLFACSDDRKRLPPMDAAAASCPAGDDWSAVQDMPCATAGVQCKQPICDTNPCVGCNVLVCQGDGSRAPRWELNHMVGCSCGDLDPSCVDATTCAPRPGC